MFVVPLFCASTTVLLLFQFIARPSTNSKAAVAKLTSIVEQLSQTIKYLYWLVILISTCFMIQLYNLCILYYQILIYVNRLLVHPHSATLIDHVVSSAALCITQSIQSTGVSDHRVQIVDHNFPICKRNPGVMWVRSSRNVIGTRCEKIWLPLHGV